MVADSNLKTQDSPGSSCRQQVLVLIPWSFTARERRRDAERRRCLHGRAIIKLWEELGFTYSEADDVRGD